MKRADHAVYVFYGCFTGDGVLTAEAFASGPHGWGVVVPSGPRRLVSNGHGGTTRHPDYAAMYRGMAFRAGQLETISGNYAYFPDSEDTRYPLVRRWAWSDRHLARTYDSQFVATPAAAPDGRAPALPAGPCPRDGTYRASFGARLNQNARYHPNQPLHLLVFPTANAYPARPTCTATVGANTPTTVYAVHDADRRHGLKSHHVTRHRWITAPAWLLVNDTGYSGKQGVSLFITRASTSPYVVKASLNVNEIRSDLGRPEPYRKKHGWEVRRRPATGTVTFRDGVLTSLSLEA